MGVLANLDRHHGCARTGQIAQSRRDVRELRSLTEAGAVQRVGRGLYRLPGADEAVVAARRLSGLVTCVSLAAHLDLPLLSRPHAAHVAVPATRGTPRPDAREDAVVHWDATVRPNGARAGVAVARALRHAVGCLDLRDVVALADAAVHRGLVSRADLEAVRPTRDRLTFERVVRAVDGRSQSLSETFLRLGLQAAGLTVEPQVLVEGLGRVDLLVDGLVAVEVDGFAYHGDRGAFREDRRRDRLAQLHGLAVVRFAHEDAVHRTASAVQEVAELVRLRRHAATLGLAVRPGVMVRDLRRR